MQVQGQQQKVSTSAALPPTEANSLFTSTWRQFTQTTFATRSKTSQGGTPTLQHLALMPLMLPLALLERSHTSCTCDQLLASLSTLPARTWQTARRKETGRLQKTCSYTSCNRLMAELICAQAKSSLYKTVPLQPWEKWSKDIVLHQRSV
jgi:hypothetical protein